MSAQVQQEPKGAPSSFGPTPSHAWEVPSVDQLQGKLEGFEIIQLLGRGGMGAVYKARQQALQRTVAIKIQPLPAGEDGLKSVERFRNEARVMAQLDHPGIVRVHDSGATADGQLYFVMEYIEGTDLEAVIRASEKLPQEEALRVANGVCEALDYAHAHGVVHRDIKPANILLSKAGEIKVVDFGLSRSEETAAQQMLTVSNVAMGTVDYAAPEMLSSGTVPDQRADLYAVGVTLYKMLTGDVPRGMFKLPSQKHPELDTRFDAIVCKAMEQDREERYQSARDISQALGEILTKPLPHGPPTKAPLWKRHGLPLALVILGVGLFVADGVFTKALPRTHPATDSTVPEVGPWKSLLANLEPHPQGLTDTWSMANGELLPPPSALQGHQTIALPLSKAPVAYDLRVRLTRHAGVSAVVLAFRHGDTGGFFMIDSWTGQGQMFLAQIGRINGDLLGTMSHRENGFLTTGQSHEVLLQVRPDHVIALMNGQTLGRWHADGSKISQAETSFFPPALMDGPIFGVGVCAAEVTFHSVEIRKVSDL